MKPVRIEVGKIIALTLCVLSLVASRDAGAGREFFAVCESCHGVRAEGNRVLDAPAIAAMEPAYFVRQIRNFQRGVRGGGDGNSPAQAMRAMSQLLTSDAQIVGVATYVASLPPTRAPAATVSGDLERGHAIYKTCAACHGANAEGNPALAAPALRARGDWYLLRQLQEFRSGKRGAAPEDTTGAQMRAIALTLTDDRAATDVIAYIESLPPFELSQSCPPSFEKIGAICTFRSLYELYRSPAGHGGLRAPLPAMRASFTPAQIDLGRYLFFDPLLSADRNASCATCHDPNQGFSDGRARSAARMGQGARSVGDDGVLLKRNAPTLWNVGFLPQLFWDGRANSLQEQSRGPLFAADEMANTPASLENALNGNRNYRELFATAFDRKATAMISVREIATALAAFESSLVSFNSRYDRYAFGDESALTDQELAGFALFRGFVARCSQCHVPPLFTDGQIAAVGAPGVQGQPYDEGAGTLPQDSALRGAFKVPTLRNIELTAPYFQAGQFSTLREVVRFYNDKRGHAVPKGVAVQVHWHVAMNGTLLSDSEVDALVAFLGTLTDRSMTPRIPDRLPSGLPLPVAPVAIAINHPVVTSNQ